MARPPAYPPPRDPKVAENHRRTHDQIRSYRTSWLYKTWPWIPVDGNGGLVTIVGMAVSLVIHEIITVRHLVTSNITTNDLIETIGRDGLLWLGLLLVILARRARLRVRRFDNHQCLKCGFDLARYEGRCPKCAADISD